MQKLLIEKENLLYLVTPNSDAIKQANFQIETQKNYLSKVLVLTEIKQNLNTKI